MNVTALPAARVAHSFLVTATACGATAPVQFALNAFGPLIAGFVFDWQGSYDPLYLAFVALLAAAALSILAAPKPRAPAVDNR